MTFDHVWFWKSRLPERKGQRCRVFARGKLNTIGVEFADGFKVATSRYAVRRASDTFVSRPRVRSSGVMVHGVPEGTAVFDGKNDEYRYLLTRTWGRGPKVLFILCNPSTADELVLDPTLRRCVAFAKRWGFGGMEVCNVFALRSSKPAALYAHADPTGPGNDPAIISAHKRASMTVVGWGAHGRHLGRAEYVLQLLQSSRKKVFALKVNGDGSPTHPLYIPARTRPRVFQSKKRGALG